VRALSTPVHAIIAPTSAAVEHAPRTHRTDPPKGLRTDMRKKARIDMRKTYRTD
jgi:hypothetical protein